MTLAYIGIGSNIDPERNITRALKMLNKEETVRRVSMFYRTASLGRPHDPRFINGVVELWTATPPAALKKALRAVERKLGRIRTTDKFSPRPVDLDILLYGRRRINRRGLRVPDPDIAARPWLAVPLAKLAPGLKIPGGPVSLRQLAGRHRRHRMKKLVSFTHTLTKELNV